MSVALPRLIFLALLTLLGSCHCVQPLIHNLSPLAVSGLDLPKLCTRAHHSAWKDVPEEEYAATFHPLSSDGNWFCYETIGWHIICSGRDLVDNCTLKKKKKSLESNGTQAEILLLFLRQKDKTQNVSENIGNNGWFSLVSDSRLALLEFQGL